MTPTDESLFLIYLELHHPKDVDLTKAKASLQTLGLDLHGGVEFVLELADIVTEDWEYGLIGTGPVQDLLESHGAEALRTLVQISNSSTLGRMLEYVHLSSTHPFYFDLVKAGKAIGVDLSEPTILNSQVGVGSGALPNMKKEGK